MRPDVDARTRVLLADDDPWTLRTTRLVLERRGYVVGTATDGGAAYAAAIEHTPDLVITDGAMPHVDGWELVQMLRAHPQLRHVPVVFVSAFATEAHRLRGFELGADAFLAKPFRYEELDLRVASALRRAAAARARAACAAIRGGLDEISIAGVLALLAQERKSGTLHLRGATAAVALRVRDGQVIAADHADAALADIDCVVEVLGWERGEFAFVDGPVEGADRIGLTTTTLLLESARRLDERSRS